MFGSTFADLHGVRRERYFRDRFPDWSRPDDWTYALMTHKLGNGELSDERDAFVEGKSMSQQPYPIWSVPNHLRVPYLWLFGMLLAIGLGFVIKEQLVYMDNTQDFLDDESIPDG